MTAFTYQLIESRKKIFRGSKSLRDIISFGLVWSY